MTTRVTTVTTDATLPRPQRPAAHGIANPTTKAHVPDPASGRSGPFQQCLLGIDPGVSGGYVLLDSLGGVLSIDPWVSPSQTVHNLDMLGCLSFVAVIEQVHASPIMPPSSCFAFGENFGQWIGILAALCVPTYGVRPQEWQLGLAIPAGTQGPERKRILKRAAQREFPDELVTLKTCDALLIASFAVRHSSQHGRPPGKPI